MIAKHGHTHCIYRTSENEKPVREPRYTIMNVASKKLDFLHPIPNWKLSVREKKHRKMPGEKDKNKAFQSLYISNLSGRAFPQPSAGIPIGSRLRQS